MLYTFILMAMFKLTIDQVYYFVITLYYFVIGLKLLTLKYSEVGLSVRKGHRAQN